MSIERLWDQIEHDLGYHDHNMRRDRPYNGQPHTDTGGRGRTEIRGITFRDLRDCYIRAICLSNGIDFPAQYAEAMKGEHAALCENDIYEVIKGTDPMAVYQNLSCEIERLMGIYPNVPPLIDAAIDDRDEGGAHG